MRIYISEEDICKTVSYEEENGAKQNLYVHDKDGFFFKELKEHDKELLRKIATKIADKMLKRLNGVCQGNYSQEHKDGYSHCVADIGDYLLQLNEEKDLYE